MKIKLPLQSLTQLFDNLANLRKAFPQLQKLGKEDDIIFADFNVGNGYLEWDLPGDEWKQFDKVSEEEKSIIAESFEKHKKNLQAKLQGSFLNNFAFSVPSSEFIYFRNKSNFEVALVAWGFRYPDRAPSGELESWIKKRNEEDVRVAFEWDGQKLPLMPFTLQGLQRQASPDGYFYFDQKLPVGNKYEFVTNDNRTFNLIVEKGQSDYIFDLTRYFTANITVFKDGEPVEGKACEIEYNGNNYQLLTDNAGVASVKLPYNCNPTGVVSEYQPDCKAKCEGEELTETPSLKKDSIDFNFNFASPEIVPPPVIITDSDIDSGDEEPPSPPIIKDEKKKKKFPWWLFLCLLPLLLLIKCKKDVEVTCYDPATQIEIPGMNVSLDYTSHFLWKDGRFFVNDSISKTAVTDSTGKVIFKDLPCSVYSYIFYCLGKMGIEAENECHMVERDNYNFHYRRHIKLEAEPRREDLHIKLLDLETGDPLPDGRIIYRYREIDEELTDTAKANPDGVVTIPAMRYCDNMDMLLGQSYGYADTMRIDMPNRQMLVADDSTAVRLRPLKERFTFFVKNEDTKEPIPGAICEVYLTNPNGRTDGPNTVTTSTDGKGIAVYEDTFILSVINITAHKEHFRDSVLTGGPWTVEEFIKQDENTRTIWLKPLPYVQELVNVDSISRRPIPGVTNIIKVTDVDGTEHMYEEISNSNGVFPVEAKEDSKVEIISTKNPEYYDKKTEIEKFRKVDDKKIPMKPETVKLKFRTINASKPSQLVPNCTLNVTGSISGSLPPTNSGSGEFEVEFRKFEYLTIVASRANWVPTTDKVSNKNYDYLKVDQERRDIPLKQNLPPCSAGNLNAKQTNEMNHQRTYGMGIEEGNASIWVDFFDEPDHLKVVDGAGNILINKNIQNKNAGGVNPIPFHFRGGSVTVIITTSPNRGSSWEYRLNCP